MRPDIRPVKKKKKGKKLIILAFLVLVLVILAGLLFNFGGIGLGLLSRNDGNNGNGPEATDNRDNDVRDEQDPVDSVLPNDVIDATEPPAPSRTMEVRVTGNSIYHSPAPGSGATVSLGEMEAALDALDALLYARGGDYDWVITSDNPTDAMWEAVYAMFTDGHGINPGQGRG